MRRNLMRPIEDMKLEVRVEDRSGDTSQTRKKAQRADPPHILLTTPESLALLLSYEDAPRIFAGLKRVVVDELHALAESKRGDQLMLCLTRLAALCPGLRRVGLSATVEDPPALANYFAPPHPTSCEILTADPGPPDPDIGMLRTDTPPPPWSGGGGRYAMTEVLDQVRQHKTTLIFHNTRAQAEIFFHHLWLANTDNLPSAFTTAACPARHAKRSRRRWSRANCVRLSAPARWIWGGSTGGGCGSGDTGGCPPQERETAGPAHRARQPPL